VILIYFIIAEYIGLGLKVSDKIARHLNKDNEGLLILSDKKGGTKVSFNICDFKQFLTTPITPNTPHTPLFHQTKVSAREDLGQ
jgi:hypothetical protein